MAVDAARARTVERTRSRGPRPRVRDLPLFWKLLVPFLALILLLGVVGGFLIVRDLSSRAQVTLNQDLLRRSLEAGGFAHDRELYLLESVNFASNLEGMAEAVVARDKKGISALLRSVMALKPDLDLLAITDARRKTISAFVNGETRAARAADRFVPAQILGVLHNSDGSKLAGVVRAGKRTILAIAAPVCSTAGACSPVGAAVVGIDMNALARAAATESARDEPGTVAFYENTGRLLSASGPAPSNLAASDRASTSLVRLNGRIGSEDVASLLAPFYVQGRRIGTLGVSAPVAPASSSVRGTALRLGLLLLAALAGIVGIGGMLSRSILRQVRSLVSTNRHLGDGDLDARAPVMSGDELGELAHGVNTMADRLQASIETLEQRVDERTQEVQRLLRERTDFFAAASHDIRTPLAVILRQADVLSLPEYASDERRQIAAGRLTEAGEHLLSLVNDILGMAEAEAGLIEVQLTDFRLRDVIEEVRHTIDGLARGFGMTVVIDADRKVPPVRADRARLREIILNLVDNAVKYTPDGGTITLSARARDGMVEVAVADSGVGIPDDIGDRIFEPFYRVKGITPQHGQTSSGLGLALTKRLVEAQGGRIWYEPRSGGGTTFTFTLIRGRRTPTRARRRLEPGRDAG